MPNFVDVAVPLPLSSLSYGIPPHLKEGLTVGSAVLVTVGGRLMPAIVLNIHDTVPSCPVKPLLAVVGSQAIFFPEQLKLLQWLASHYLVPIGSALSTFLPRVFRLTHLSFTQPIQVSPDIETLLNGLTFKKISYKEINQQLGKKKTHKILTSLLANQSIQVTLNLPDVLPSLPIDNISLSPLPPPSVHLLSKITHSLANQRVVLLSDIDHPYALYMHLIQAELMKNNQVLLLYPDILRAIDGAKIMEPFFKGYIAIYHGQQSSKFHIESWIKVKKNAPLLVIGTRSALFLPFHRLMLTIIDQEEDIAYKQTAMAPFYHAREVALAGYPKNRVLLSSMTPSIESYHYAEVGCYGLVQLLPSKTPFQLKLVNLNHVKKKATIWGLLSPLLIEAIQQTQARGEKILIFHNRRGYARGYVCTSCGWTADCPNCALSLTYHQTEGKMICRYCSYSTLPYPSCTQCGASTLRHQGMGIEQVQEALYALFPDQKIARIDVDTIKTKAQYRALNTRWMGGQIDILVATEVVTRRLNLDSVALVAVLNIDQHLHFPDFRSNERCFQLIRQLIPKIENGNKTVDLWIQTREPNHPLFKYLSTNNYLQMYAYESAERKYFDYPPYTRLVKVTLSGTNIHQVNLAIKSLKEYFICQISVAVTGPHEPTIERVNRLFLRYLMVKVSIVDDDPLIQTQNGVYQAAKKFLANNRYKNLKLMLDVDP